MEGKRENKDAITARGEIGDLNVMRRKDMQEHYTPEESYWMNIISRNEKGKTHNTKHK
jgi:hypothetical protein